MDHGVNDLDDPVESGDPGRHVPIIGRSTMNASYSIVRSRGASSWLLTWTLAGAGRLTHDDVSVSAHRHDLVILGPDVRQRYGTLEAPWDFAWSHFQPRPAWRRGCAPGAPAASSTAPTSTGSGTPGASTAPSPVPSATFAV